MKVGIMSMQRVINYGSYMQALSLKSILEGLGHEVVFVDYKARPSIQHRRSLRYWLHKWKQAIVNTRLYRLLFSVLHGKAIERRAPKGPKVYKGKEKAFVSSLEEMGVDYEHFHYRRKVDALIIGSDEVFNCLQNADNVGYSLELFGKNNRAKILLSYAASFGNTTLDRLNEYGVSRQIGRYLRRFDYLSVRDENSAQIVRALTGREPFQHLDPVLIGDIENRQWEENDVSGYIAVYAYSNRISEEEGKKISSFAKKNGLRVINISGTQKHCDFETIRNCTPKEIIPYVKHAEMVITDTFHGTIFAMINHVPFAVYCRRSQNFVCSNSEKLLDMLNKLNMMDRLVSEENDLETIFGRSIDFEAFDRIRERERTASLAYLRKALSGEEIS